MFGLMTDSDFNMELGGQAAEINKVRTNVLNKVTDTAQAIEEQVVQFSAIFETSLANTCLIKVRPGLTKLIEASVDAELDALLGQLLQPGFAGIPQCPNRSVIQTVLQQSIATG